MKKSPLLLIVIPFLAVSIFMAPAVSAQTSGDMTLSQLQALVNSLLQQVQVLQAQVAALISGNGSVSTGGNGTASGANAYVGNAVITNRTLNTRSKTSISNDTLLAVIPNGTPGTVLQGPIYADGYNWYQVSYNNTTSGSNVVGWSVGVGLNTTTIGGGDTVCTQEVMRCADGSYVGRIPPSCAFAACSVTGSVSITSLSPSSGPMGTSITITGTGFTNTNNTIKFGNGYYTGYVNSTNGTTLQITIPDGVSPCPPSGGCLAYSQLSLGAHQVSIQNANGTSNQVNFTLTQ